MAGIVLVAMFLVIYKCYVESLGQGHGFKSGDWLINYAAGPVRRGLVGELIHRISDAGVSIKWVLFLTQTIFLLVAAIIPILIFVRQSACAVSSLLLLSPAYLMFQFFDLNGGMRKEVIVFAAFAVLMLSSTKPQQARLLGCLSVSLFGLAVFSHEGMAFVLPFFLLVVLRLRAEAVLTSTWAASLAALFAILAVAALIFAALFPGGAYAADEICKTVMQKGYPRDVCGGAIRWLSSDFSGARQSVTASLKQYITTYPLYLLFALIPFVISGWLRRNSFVATIGFLCVLPLFAIAADWGRWIHIYVYFLSGLMLMDARGGAHAKVAVHPVWVVLFATGWYLPHYSPAQLPVGQALKELRSEGAKVKSNFEATIPE